LRNDRILNINEIRDVKISGCQYWWLRTATNSFYYSCWCFSQSAYHELPQNNREFSIRNVNHLNVIEGDHNKYQTAWQCATYTYLRHNTSSQIRQQPIVKFATQRLVLLFAVWFNPYRQRWMTNQARAWNICMLNKHGGMRTVQADSDCESQRRCACRLPAGWDRRVEADNRRWLQTSCNNVTDKWRRCSSSYCFRKCSLKIEKREKRGSWN